MIWPWVGCSVYCFYLIGHISELWNSTITRWIISTLQACTAAPVWLSTGSYERHALKLLWERAGAPLNTGVLNNCCEERVLPAKSLIKLFALSSLSSGRALQGGEGQVRRQGELRGVHSDGDSATGWLLTLRGKIFTIGESTQYIHNRHAVLTLTPCDLVCCAAFFLMALNIKPCTRLFSSFIWTWMVNKQQNSSPKLVMIIWLI